MLGVATHGERFVCAIERPPIYGVQFHPEKSSGAGLRLLGELRRALRLGSRVILYPAIDVRDGRAVRLVQGDYERETVFDADPSEAARRWVEQGAAALHVVDLDGAREGAPVNIEQVERICEAVEVPVQVGGGLRQADDVDAVLAVGAVRAILGTAALSDPALVEALAAEHGDADRGLGRRPLGRGGGRGLAARDDGHRRRGDRRPRQARGLALRLHPGRGRRHARRARRSTRCATRPRPPRRARRS